MVQATASTQEQWLFYKAPVLKQLKDSFFDQEQFKKSYDQYLSFYNGQQDPHIQQALKLSFEKAMKNELYELDTMKNQLVELEKNKISLNQEKTILRKIDGTRIIKGIALCAGSLAMGTISVLVAKQALESVYWGEGVGMIPVAFLAAIGMGLGGIGGIIGGLNHQQIIRDETAKEIKTTQNIIKNILRNIETLDANYAYAFPQKEKLSVQVNRN